MELVIDNRQKKMNLEDSILDGLENVITQCLLYEGKGLNYEVSISFVDDEEIRELNRDYRGKDKSTDVLSFPMFDDDSLEIDGIPSLLGDIVISLETAQRQAIEFNHSLKREIFYLTVHSMFHLMGYDHMNDEEKKIMREKEKDVMKILEVFKTNK